MNINCFTFPLFKKTKEVNQLKNCIKSFQRNCFGCTFTDHSKGFGGKYGVQTDRVDANAESYEYQPELQKHSSQKGKTCHDNVEFLLAIV